ncbi:hypothetical protein ACTXG7_00730 [Mycolicibacterium sp. Dal123E01]|uniref:hypothetical protein n=1 Tax=Mycolicibacterium sp. Dal123E01 TaxID=3457578 RepID=UPI00403E669C
MTNPADLPEEGGPGDTLNPAESLDSDEVRNDDGDTVVDPPDGWSQTNDGESLDERLSEEEPDVVVDDRDDEVDTDVDTDGAPQDRAHRGQISGSPEDGDSLYPVIE